VHVATLVAIAVVLAVCVRGQWFFGDEWDFIVLRGVHHAARGLWQPHNEHWSTLPILWYRALFSLVGLKSYAPYLATLFAVHLAAVHALWRLTTRAGVPVLLATAGVCVFGLFGAGSDNLLWAFQVGFVSSLTAGLYLALALDDEGSRRRVAAVAGGAIASLLLSGISVVMVAALGVGALGRWGWRKAVAVTAPAAVTYLVWLEGPGGNGLDTNNSNGVRDIPAYVWGGFRAAFGEPLHSRRAGGVVALVLVAALAVGVRSYWRRAPEIVGLALAAVLMYAVISQGRGAIQPPDVSRYRYLAFALVLPFILLTLAAAARRFRPVELVAVAGAAALVVSGAAQLRTNARTDSAVKLGLRDQFLASISVAAHDRTLLTDKPDFMFGSDVSVAQLRRLREHGRLPRWNRSARSVAAARLGLELVVSSRGAPDTSCVSRSPTTPDAAAGPVAGDWAFGLHAQQRSLVQLFLRYTGGAAGPRLIQLEAGKAARVRAIVRGPMIVRVTSGAVRVCGAAVHG
jgi:hypothetical protein